MYSSINIVYEENVIFDFKLVPQNDYLVMHGGGVNLSDWVPYSRHFRACNS